MTSMKNKIILSALTTCLIGCGSGGDVESGDISVKPIVSAEENIQFQLAIVSTTAAEANLNAKTFLEVQSKKFVEPVFPSEVTTGNNDELGCEVESRVFGASSVDQNVNEDSPVENSQNISAGEVLTISSSAGTWAEVYQNEDSLFTGFYTANNNEADLGVLPENSTIDVPGDMFPQLSSVTLLTPTVLTNVEFRENAIPLAESDLVTPNTSMHWDKGEVTSNSVIFISFSNSNETESRFVQCRVEDNGQFEFPDAIKEVMDESYKTHRLFRIEKRSEQRDNVLITQFATSTYQP